MVADARRICQKMGRTVRFGQATSARQPWSRRGEPTAQEGQRRRHGAYRLSLWPSPEGCARARATDPPAAKNLAARKASYSPSRLHFLLPLSDIHIPQRRAGARGSAQQSGMAAASKVAWAATTRLGDPPEARNHPATEANTEAKNGDQAGTTTSGTSRRGSQCGPPAAVPSRPGTNPHHRCNAKTRPTCPLHGARRPHRSDATTGFWHSTATTGGGTLESSWPNAEGDTDRSLRGAFTHRYKCFMSRPTQRDTMS